jgi:hypothetical protein
MLIAAGSLLTSALKFAVKVAAAFVAVNWSDRVLNSLAYVVPFIAPALTAILDSDVIDMALRIVHTK